MGADNVGDWLAEMAFEGKFAEMDLNESKFGDASREAEEHDGPILPGM